MAAYHILDGEAPPPPTAPRGSLAKMGVLAVLLLVALGAAGYSWYRYLHPAGDTPPGALLAVACGTHEHVSRVRVCDLAHARCPVCSDPVGYAMKCTKCGNPQPWIPALTGRAGSDVPPPCRICRGPLRPLAPSAVELRKE